MAIKKQNTIRRAFTLMELLVVIAIIMMLIGILVPGMQGVKRIAKNLEQKSLFHNIDIGLETYRKDYEDFPDSKRKFSGGLYYTGAQHLAEALVGRDSRGFEPKQAGIWQWPNLPAGSILYTTDPKSLARRKPLYVNLKDTGAFTPEQLYGTGNTGDVVFLEGIQRAPVIADMFYRKKIINGLETIKVGSPILYYKANRSSKLFKKDGTPVAGQPMPLDYSKWKFNFNDNDDLVKLGTIEDPAGTLNEVLHQMLNPADFYTSIADTNAPFDRPLNENSYILISAGYDGIFGTKDDVTNIKKK